MDRRVMAGTSPAFTAALGRTMDHRV
jgi:hypothetical protein